MFIVILFIYTVSNGNYVAIIDDVFTWMCKYTVP